MPAHHAAARTALFPIGVPSSSPRTVSVTGLTGSYRANHRRPAGIDAVGTKPLLRNGSSIRNIGRVLAVSTLLLTSPRGAEDQASAKLASARRPRAAGRGRGVAGGREPVMS